MITFNEEESKWIDGQMELLRAIEENPTNYTDEEVQSHFDNFYQTVCDWQSKYPTKHLNNFWAIGVGYDGFMPGNNPSFLGLYKELMGYVRNKRADEPIRYSMEKDGEWVMVEENEDGTKIISKDK